MTSTTTYLKHSPTPAWPRSEGMCLDAGGSLLSRNVQETEVQPSFASIQREDRNYNLNKEAGR